MVKVVNSGKKRSYPVYILVVGPEGLANGLTMKEGVKDDPKVLA